MSGMLAIITVYESELLAVGEKNHSIVVVIVGDILPRSHELPLGRIQSRGIPPQSGHKSDCQKQASDRAHSESAGGGHVRRILKNGRNRRSLDIIAQIRRTASADSNSEVSAYAGLSDLSRDSIASQATSTFLALRIISEQVARICAVITSSTSGAS